MRVLNFSLVIFLMWGLTACSKDSDENKEQEPYVPIQSVGFYSNIIDAEWSADEHRNAQIAEVRSNVGDFVMTANEHDGYSLRMTKDSKKDDRGYFVYRIFVDMQQITDTTTTNTSDIVKWSINLTGTGIDAGEIKSVKRNIEAQIHRVKVMKLSNEALRKIWILTKAKLVCLAYSYNWIPYFGQYVSEEPTIITFDKNESPLQFNGIIERGETSYDKDGNIVGMERWTWDYVSDGWAIGFAEGNWSFSYNFRNGVCTDQQNGHFGNLNNTPMIIWQDGDELRCQADDYDESGVIRYNFEYTFEALKKE